MTARGAAAVWAKRAASVETEFAANAAVLKTGAERFCHERLQTTVYAVPEDTNAAGEKLWERTGKLLAGEKAEIIGTHTVRMVNEQVYAKPRHEYGRPGDKRKINPARVSFWRDDLAAEYRPISLALYRRTMQKILGGG